MRLKGLEEAGVYTVGDFLELVFYGSLTVFAFVYIVVREFISSMRGSND